MPLPTEKRSCGVQDALGTYSDSYIDAPFYTNHDMGRGAGYYSGDTMEAQTKLAQAMNLLMSGSSFLYYGEELGMKGAGKDENKRAPMYWSKDAGAEGMCLGPQDMDAITMIYDSLAVRSRTTRQFHLLVCEGGAASAECLSGDLAWNGRVS